MEPVSPAEPETKTCPYGNRSADTAQIVGGVAPIEVRASQGMTPEHALALEKLSAELHRRMSLVRHEFLGQQEGLSYEDETYVALDAAAALMASWVCSSEHVQKCGMDLPSGIMSSVELVQHNFMQRQQDLYSKIGRYTH